MSVTVNSGTLLSRHYIAGRYECDSLPSGQVKERLYLGGDAYSAPMVYQRDSLGGAWTAYNIGRDYLGNITHVVTNSGSLVAEYSYDPWGRLRNPGTLEIFAAGSEPALFLGRGFTGHEHLPWFALVNMNARLYDPLVGRFLSPDPFVQAPDFTQNFNRYSYALNNPLKYTDPNGEFFILDSFLIGLIGGGWERAKQMAWNDLKIWGGLFIVDKNKGFWGGTLEILSRLTWQLPQTAIGFLVAHSVNTFRIEGGLENVDYFHGATVSRHFKNDWGGITFGSYIMGDNSIEARDDNDLFQHEFGHYLQSQEHGILWLFDFAIESGISAIVNDYDQHVAFYTEQDANARSLKYFAQYYGESYAQAIWNIDSNPIVGYDKTKTYCDNLSVIEGAIIPLTLDVFFRKKQDIEESVIIDQYPGIPETTPIIL